MVVTLALLDLLGQLEALEQQALLGLQEELAIQVILAILVAQEVQESLVELGIQGLLVSSTFTLVAWKDSMFVTNINNKL